MNQQPGAVYNVHLRFRRDYSIYACASEAEKSEDEDLLFSDEDEWSYYNNYYYNQGYSYDDPCGDYYYTRNYGIQRNILASGLGILAKQEGDESVFIAVTDLNTAKPVQGCEVDIYNFSQRKINYCGF